MASGSDDYIMKFIKQKDNTVNAFDLCLYYFHIKKRYFEYCIHMGSYVFLVSHF
jgi:hypothetical protein